MCHGNDYLWPIFALAHTSHEKSINRFQSGWENVWMMYAVLSMFVDEEVVQECYSPKLALNRR